MYIRLKIYQRKEDDKLNNPILSYEVNGTHAIRLIIIYLLDFAGYSSDVKSKIREELEKSEF